MAGVYLQVVMETAGINSSTANMTGLAGRQPQSFLRTGAPCWPLGIWAPDPPTVTCMLEPPEAHSRN